jgi:rhamnose utilization protein RhaD (predicted bifunctional aldolase and dehydrogenase)/NAD(P)-dependent dehydrogenase (short-subunit alcohol dehydrogenase family)
VNEVASEYNWDDIDWDGMSDDLDRIVALSRYYGSDPDFLLAGGGNTSMKTGDTLYIKASGISLADIERDGFVEMVRGKVRDILTKCYSTEPLEREEQVKNDMLAARRHQESEARPSVETMFHEQIDYKFVVHTHPSLINGLTCAEKGRAIAEELFGDDALWIDYAPGYTLAKKVQSALTRYRKTRDGKEPAIILLQNHGVFVGADDPHGIKSITDGIVAGLKAYMSQENGEPVFGGRNPLFPEGMDQDSKIKELAPALRAILTVDGRCPVITYSGSSGSELVMEFVSSEHGEMLARSEAFTPDQIVYCKRKPLWVSRESCDEDAQEIANRMGSGVRKFISRYGYTPRIVLIQGMGMFGIGDSKRSADIASAVYEDALKIMKNSTAFGGPRFMNNRQARFIDEWEVEKYRRRVAAAEYVSGRVAGKVAVVTGAAQGFGEGIARELAREGAYVVIADINLDGAQALADALNKQHGDGNAIAIKTDVTDEKSVSDMIMETVRGYSGIDIFVSNAGVLRAGSVKTLALKDFEFVTKVNYTGYFLCVKHAAPVMAAQHKRDPAYTSDIIQINSKSGLQGSNKNAAYAGSKFGGIGLTQSFALELVEDGIKVNSICPGNFLDGPLWSDPENGLFVQYLRAGKVPGAKTVEDVRRFYESKVPMGRGCTVQDVMRAIYYVIEQAYETGQAILVTGGQLMK